MDAQEVTKLQADAWKTTIEVQQHFNDIEMRIRALAITVFTAVLGGAAVAVKNGTILHVAHHPLSLGAAILIIGIVAWLLFLFVDALWYHRLLKGAVKHGIELEKMLKEGGVPGFGLTTAIGDASPFRPFWISWKKVRVHSTAKIWTFYLTVGATLAGAAVILILGTVNPATHGKPKAPSSTTTVSTTTTP